VLGAILATVRSPKLSQDAPLEAGAAPGNCLGKVCTNCGSIFDADVNAAKNIVKLGVSPTGRLLGMTCESSRTTGRKQEEDA
jgi:hypothetical protein